MGGGMMGGGMMGGSPPPTPREDEMRAFFEELHSPDPEIRRQAILLFRYDGNPPVQILRQASQDPSPQVRMAAIRVGASSPNTRETAFLIQGGLIDTDPTVRRVAAESLSSYRSNPMFGSMLHMAQTSPDSQVQGIAEELIHSLGEMHHPLPILERTGRLGTVRNNVDETTPPHAPEIPRSHLTLSNVHVPTIPHLEDLHHSSKRILHRRLENNYVSTSTFHLKRDYEAAQAVLNEVKSRPHQEGQYKINYDFISEDPFLYSHSKDIHQIYPNPVSDREWLEMREALKIYPVVAGLGSGLDSVFEKAQFFGHDSELEAKTKETIRKRMKRLFDDAKHKEKLGAAGRVAASPGGDLAVNLYVNLDRCIDGLQSGLSDLEKEHFAEGEPESSGDLISRIFTDYKMQFIEKHGDLNHASSEFKTTAPQILRQRMLYSLGLRGSEAEIAYPGLGNPDYPEMKPGRVMARFLAGERVQFPNKDHTVEFEPFNLDHMVKLLRDSRERGLMNAQGLKPLHPDKIGMKLKTSFIQEIALADPILADAYTEFHTDSHQPNEYFEAAPAGEFAGNIRLKDKFWLHILEANGYISR